LGGLVLLIAFIALAPLYVCMGPWTDNSLFDLCARSVLNHQPVYHNYFFHGPPGLVLTFSVLHAILGWHSEAIRLVEVVILLAIFALLAWRFLPAQASSAFRLWTMTALWFYYTSTSEWCHCQPDVWMLLPAFTALSLRQRAVERWSGAGGERADCGSAFVEGFLYGAAFVIKPFVALPILFVWVISALQARRSRCRRSFILQAVWTGVGLLTLLGLVLAWVQWSGNWSDFWSSIFGDWNQDYFAGSEGWWWRTKKALWWFGPWTMLHLAALPLSLASLVEWLILPNNGLRDDPSPLVSAFYLGLLLQAIYLQHQLVYQMIPPVFLAVTIVASCICRLEKWRIPAAGLALAAMLSWAIAYHPLLQPHRLSAWLDCWRQGSSPAVRNRLAVETDLSAADWVRLAQVQDFLRKRRIRDGQLTCYAPSSVHLYSQLNVKPSTRYIFIMPAMAMFPRHRNQIQRDIVHSSQRYVVNDLLLLNMSRDEADREIPGRPTEFPTPPPSAPSQYKEKFPFCFPVVFRAGRYLVHELPSQK
jgi:hypothetical protein